MPLAEGEFHKTVVTDKYTVNMAQGVGVRFKAHLHVQNAGLAILKLDIFMLVRSPFNEHDNDSNLLDSVT